MFAVYNYIITYKDKNNCAIIGIDGTKKSNLKEIEDTIGGKETKGLKSLEGAKSPKVPKGP